MTLEPWKSLSKPQAGIVAGIAVIAVVGVVAIVKWVRNKLGGGAVTI